MIHTVRFLLIFFFFCFFAFSCKRKLRIVKDQKDSIPYFGNERLSFVSNFGEKDTFFLNGYKSYFADESKSIVNKRIVEHYDLMCINQLDSTETFFIALTAKPKNSPLFSFNILNVPRGYFFWNTLLYDSLFMRKAISLAIDSVLYSDVIIILNKKLDTKTKFTDSTNEKNISRIYWSKSRGLVRFDLINGKEWYKVSNSNKLK